MAGASRLVRTSRALQSSELIPFSDSCRLPSLKFLRSGGEPPGWRGRKRVAISLDTAVISPERKREPCFFEKGMEIMKLSSSRIAQVAGLGLGLFGPPRSEMLVEKGIIGCRSFTLIAVAGSLIGSVLCFVEGCFLVLETFIEYFHMISHRVDQGGIVHLHLLIEALDMFLVGTALLTFGMGMYVMFAGSSQMIQNRGWQIVESSFGSFNLKKLAKTMEMRSISEAKSKIGHAILLILQTGVLEKFKNVPLASALDLACFAGALFISSACVFLLSKLTMPPSKIRCT